MRTCVLGAIKDVVRYVSVVPHSLLAQLSMALYGRWGFPTKT